MSESIRQIIKPHVKDLGGFEARRILPHELQQMVGPFIFFDRVGPGVFAPGKGVDVRPHPHINLATVTYLFDGVLLHRDSLGNVQEIHPGAVNWMTAGKGIVHSERSPEAERQRESPLNGIQTWIALPDEQEETEPSFSHYPATDLPSWSNSGVDFKLIAGEAYGHTSPVQTFSPMLYLDVKLNGGTEFTIPADYRERAVYSVTEGLVVDGTKLEVNSLAILEPNSLVSVTAESEARCIIIGGEPVGGRYKWWNFISSRRDRIEQAKKDWQEGNFAPVPQETEFIPLPESVSEVGNPA